MRSIKAVVLGSIFIIVMMLFLQLAFMIVVVAYNYLAADYPVLNDIVGVFRYLVGIPVFMLVMFVGGYVTASLVDIPDNRRVWIHSFAVGAITVTAMMYSAMSNFELTVTGLAVIVLAISASSVGGFYWLKKAQIAITN
ncbi:MAG: hypothetical protein ISR69_01355 [Gammaproteobacteria bacterium]|nr:hypothetical protein [Gammaproteobacteria bacterium]